MQSGSESDLDDSLNTEVKQRPVRVKKVPVRYPDSELKVIPKKMDSTSEPVAASAPAAAQAAAGEAPTSGSLTTNMVNSRPALTYVCAPQEIPNFRGNVLPGEPPAQGGTAEVDVEAWLHHLTLHFESTGLTDDRSRIRQLVQHTHKKLGDARTVVSKYLNDDHMDFTFEEVRRDLLLTYAGVTNISFVDASRELMDVALSAKPHKVSATGNVYAIRDAALKVAKTFVNRPSYNAAADTRSTLDILTEAFFAFGASLVFKKRIVTDTLLKRKENDRVANAYQALTHFLVATEKEIYRNQNGTSTVTKVHVENKPSSTDTSSATAASAPTRGNYNYRRGRGRYRGRFNNRGNRGGTTSHQNPTSNNSRGGNHNHNHRGGYRGHQKESQRAHAGVSRAGCIPEPV
ncbi:uncharacterized protein LOC125179280 [Hyalella azteca]|uniref:Uncharacterized protein LOC125179280 n=1 Tax=Hyalella azteca TaxID=294128 RepID=A0A979FUB1_HYAAZ|nr:uncharacterized protein LOC125179280 [Hyalella azteca]